MATETIQVSFNTNDFPEDDLVYDASWWDRYGGPEVDRIEEAADNFASAIGSDLESAMAYLLRVWHDRTGEGRVVREEVE